MTALVKYRLELDYWAESLHSVSLDAQSDLSWRAKRLTLVTQLFQQLSVIGACFYTFCCVFRRVLENIAFLGQSQSSFHSSNYSHNTNPAINHRSPRASTPPTAVRVLLLDLHVHSVVLCHSVENSMIRLFYST